MATKLHGQSDALAHIFSFLGFYDLDGAGQVNQEWNALSKKCESERLKLLRAAFDYLEPPSCKIGDFIPLVRDARNEEETFEALGKMEKLFRGVHLGVSSLLHNLDYVVAMRSRFLILIDGNAYVSGLNSLAIRLMRTSKTRETFEKDFFKQFNTMRQFNQDTPTPSQKQFTAWKQKTFSAFHTEKGFLYIKKLVDQDRFVTVTCSLQDETIIPRIARIVHRTGLAFASLYLSTGFYWSDSQDGGYEAEKPKYEKRLAAYRGNVERLKDDKTCIIDVWKSVSN